MTGTKPKVATIKLEPGTDLVGPVKFVSFYPEKIKDGEKYSAQWGLTGTWNGVEGRVYISTYMLTSDIKVYIEQDGKWDDGSPKLKWTGKGSFRLHPYVKDKKHYVTVGPVDGSSSIPAAGRAAPAPAASVPSYDDGKWSDLERTYERCVEIAVKAWKLDQPKEAMVAAAATVFIEANKRGLTIPKSAEQQAASIRDTVDSFAGMPAALKEEPDPELPEWMRG